MSIGHVKPKRKNKLESAINFALFVFICFAIVLEILTVVLIFAPLLNKL